MSDGQHEYYGTRHVPEEPQKTLRDEFAMAADISSYTLPDFDSAARVMGIDPPHDESFGEVMRFSFRLQAALRYAIADAMLAARNG